METKPKYYAGLGNLKKPLMALVLLGVVGFFVTLTQNAERAWANYLMNYFFWMNIAMAGLFFAALQHITGAYWSATIRRVSESLSAYIPVSFVLFIGLLFGLHHLYEWTHADVVQHDELLKMKSGYLNIPFFIVRHVGLYLLCLFLGRKIVNNSLSQDEQANAALSVQNTKLSAPFLMLFAVLYTLASVDLIMSLAPHWFSTMFGVYCWAGLFFSGLGMLAIWVVALRNNGVLADFVNEDHLHDLGKFMFAFLVFWGYVGFSQYMLIWYANLPEETPYMIARTQGAYKNVGIILMLVKFVIPLFLLISRPAKRSKNFLLFMGFWFLVAQYVDVYWMVIPAFFKAPIFGWNEVVMFIGFGALYFLSVGRFLEKVSPVAINDPWLPAALHHHNTPNGY